MVLKQSWSRTELWKCKKHKSRCNGCYRFVNFSWLSTYSADRNWLGHHYFKSSGYGGIYFISNFSQYLHFNFFTQKIDRLATWPLNDFYLLQSVAGNSNKQLRDVGWRGMETEIYFSVWKFYFLSESVLFFNGMVHW